METDSNHFQMKLEEFLELDLEKRFGVKAEELANRINHNPSILDSGMKYEDLIAINDCFSVQFFLREHSIGRNLNEPCEKCNSSEVYCGFEEEKNTRDYYYTFWHICLNCLDSKYDKSHIGYGQESEKDTECPFCRHRW